MMNNDIKYELANDLPTKTVGGTVLHRVRALKSFGKVIEGDLGGYVESYNNLSPRGNSWLDSDSFIKDSALLSGASELISSNLYGTAVVRGKSSIADSSIGDCVIVQNGFVYDSHVTGSARIFGGMICTVPPLHGHLEKLTFTLGDNMARIGCNTMNYDDLYKIYNGDYSIISRIEPYTLQWVERWKEVIVSMIKIKNETIEYKE